MKNSRSLYIKLNQKISILCIFIFWMNTIMNAINLLAILLNYWQISKYRKSRWSIKKHDNGKIWTHYWLKTVHSYIFITTITCNNKCNKQPNVPSLPGYLNQEHLMNSKKKIIKIPRMQSLLLAKMTKFRFRQQNRKSI